MYINLVILCNVTIHKFKDLMKVDIADARLLRTLFFCCTMAVFIKKKTKHWHLILFLVQAQHSILSAVVYWGQYFIKIDHPLFHHPSPLHLSLSLSSFSVLHSIFRVKNVKCCLNVSTLTARPVRHLQHSGRKNRAL